MKLYGYWRSTAAYRVRIALNIKQLQYESLSVHLVKDGGEQHKDAYREINPQGLVPTLVDGSLKLSQSMAILDYLEQTYPEPRLLPKDISMRAMAIALAQSIACDIHPLNNLRILKYLTGELNQDEQSKQRWYAHWIVEGFAALEKQLSTISQRGPFAMGDELSWVDLCLIPQVYNANRFAVDISPFARINEINQYCMQLPEFIQAAPESQPDAVTS